MTTTEREAIQLLHRMGRRAGFKRLLAYVVLRAREAGPESAWADLETLLSIDLEAAALLGELRAVGIRARALNLADSGQALTCDVLVRETGCARNYAYNVLATLAASGLLRRVGQGRYRRALLPVSA